MAAEWLRADQVAAIGQRHQPYPSPVGQLCDEDEEEWPCDAATLLAQDGRCRALVGELAEWCDILLTLTDATAPIVEATYGQADPEGWVAQRETVACIRARLRQRLAALDGAV
jgi:hypothetical protein